MLAFKYNEDKNFKHDVAHSLSVKFLFKLSQ